jgi:hypothetical protein
VLNFTYITQFHGKSTTLNGHSTLAQNFENFVPDCTAILSDVRNVQMSFVITPTGWESDAVFVVRMFKGHTGERIMATIFKKIFKNQ